METPRYEFHRFQATGCQGMWRRVKILICNFKNNVASACFSQNFVIHIYFYVVQTVIFIRCTMKMHYFLVFHRMLPTTKGYLYVLHQQAPLAQIKVKIDGTNIYIYLYIVNSQYIHVSYNHNFFVYMPTGRVCVCPWGWEMGDCFK